jgi:hypothetical protein
LEHLAPAEKVEGSVNSPDFEKVPESPSEGKLHGLIEPKLEPVDCSEFASSCDDTSQHDAAGQGAHDIASSSLDHDYFGVMNGNFKEESEDGCESVQALAACESVESLPGCESVQSLLSSSQAKEFTDACRVKSSVLTGDTVQNHMLEGAPVMQKHKATNSIPLIPKLQTQPETVNNHVLEQNVPLAKNSLKLGTLMKCINKNGQVFFLTVRRASVKSQLKLASVVPKLEQSAHVPNLTSLLIKQAPNPLLQNKLSPPAVVASKSSQNSPTPSSQVNSYNCKVKGSGTSEDNLGLSPSQTNSSLLVPPQGSVGNGVTTQASVHSLLSLGAKSSSSVTTKGPSLVMNLKPGMKVTSPVILVKDSPEVLKQLQSSFGHTLSFLKPNRNVLAADELEEGNKLEALNDMIRNSTQNKSAPVQDQPLLIAKNGRLYLVKHPESAVALSALTTKSSSKKFGSIPKQQDTILPSTVQGSQSLLSNPTCSVKPGVSLLKKHMKTVVLPPVEKLQNLDKSEDCRLLMSGRTLVLNKGNSRQITRSDRLCYLEDLK